MAWDVGVLAQYFKLPARFYSVAAVVSGVLLFAPVQFLSIFALQKIATDYRDVIGLCFLLAVSLVLMEVSLQIWRYITDGRRKKKDLVAKRQRIEEEALRKQQENKDSENHLKQRLLRLTRDEKDMLRPFVVGDIRSRRLPMNNATRHALHGASILIAAAQVSEYDRRVGDYVVDVAIQPWAMEELKRRPELLDPNWGNSAGPKVRSYSDVAGPSIRGL